MLMKKQTLLTQNSWEIYLVSVRHRMECQNRSSAAGSHSIGISGYFLLCSLIFVSVNKESAENCATYSLNNTLFDSLYLERSRVYRNLYHRLLRLEIDNSLFIRIHSLYQTLKTLSNNRLNKARSPTKH